VIAVDTSALMAIVLNAPEADTCEIALARDDNIIVSAGTLAEALIVSSQRNLGTEMASLIERLGCTVISVTPAVSQRVAQAYIRWGKGNHPARLNFGDCFAYEVAKEHACPLLFVGKDFAKTDIESAL
jgi:ribonuclease VapC